MNSREYRPDRVTLAVSRRSASMFVDCRTKSNVDRTARSVLTPAVRFVSRVKRTRLEVRAGHAVFAELVALAHLPPAAQRPAREEIDRSILSPEIAPADAEEAARREVDAIGHVAAGDAVKAPLGLHTAAEARAGGRQFLDADDDVREVIAQARLQIDAHTPEQAQVVQAGAGSRGGPPLRTAPRAGATWPR